MKKCKYCGAEIRDGARFCVHCMTSFEEKTLIPPITKSVTPLIVSAVALILVVSLAVSAVAVACFSRPRKGGLPVTETAGENSTSSVGTTPEQTTPEQTTPEQITPEQTTPEQITPEEITVPEGYIPIYDKYDFNDIRNAPDKNYILMSDIFFEKSDFEAGGAFYNGGNGWERISFLGILDGNGKALINFQYASGTLSPFLTNQGTIKNLGIKGREVTLDNADNVIIAGMIVMQNTGEIVGCYNEVDVTVSCVSGKNVWVAGVACANFGSIRKCANYGNITVEVTSSAAGPRVGGIAVEMKCESFCLDQVYEISECYNGGNIYVSGEYSNEVAGIVACCECLCSKTHSPGRCVVRNCYNEGRITSVRNCSGIIGTMWAPDVELGKELVVVENVLNSGYVSVKGDFYASGVALGFFTGVRFSSCYYLFYASDCTVEAGTALTPEQMIDPRSFAGFDFENVWYIDDSDGYGYPRLICHRRG